MNKNETIKEKALFEFKNKLKNKAFIDSEFKKVIISTIEANLEEIEVIAKQIKIDTKFYIIFIIEYDGSISHVKVLSSFNKKYNPEIIKIVSHMPKWEPGKEDDKAIRFLYDLNYPL